MEKKVYDLSFWKVIAAFEDSNDSYPFDDYFSVDRKDISFIRRLAKIEHRLKWMLSTVQNARVRFREGIMHGDSEYVARRWCAACEENGINAGEYKESKDYDDVEV